MPRSKEVHAAKQQNKKQKQEEKKQNKVKSSNVTRNRRARRGGPEQAHNTLTHGVIAVVVPNSKNGVKPKGPPQFQNIPIPYSTEQVGDMKINCVFEPTALELNFVTLASYLISKGLVNNLVNDGLETPWDNVYAGINKIMSGICSEIQGGPVELSTVPKIVNDLIAGLKPKSAGFSTYGDINYSWGKFSVTSCDIRNEMSAGGGVWRPLYIDPDSDKTVWNSPATLWKGSSTSDDELYSGFLRLLDENDCHKNLKLVEHGAPSDLKKDVSAFSRVYVYNGLQPVPTAGYWKSVESEVPITCPMMANYCQYGKGDERAAHHYTKYSGDSGLMTGWALHETFAGFFNKTPPVFKQIDFEEIYTSAVTWMCRAKEKFYQTTRTQANENTLASQPFLFSEQDFRIALRQALISNYWSQYMVQFVGTVGADTPGQGFFVPFQVNGGTGPNAKFESMFLPSLIVENLASLEPRTLQFPGHKGSKQVTLQAPVFGLYLGDEPLHPQFQNNDTEVPMVSLFADLSKTQQVVNLIDGTYGANHDHINFNATYYQNVMADWNYHVELLCEYTEEYQAFKLDGGAPGFGTLGLTRIVEPVPVNVLSAPKHIAYVQSLRNVQNGVPSMDSTPPMVKQDSKSKLDVSKTKKPKAIAPGSMVKNGVLALTSNRKLFMEEEGFYANLILPSVRLSPKEDALTATMYQTEVREALSTWISNKSDLGGGSMWTKMSQLASFCVTGLAKQDSNMYTKIIEHLQLLSQAGFLSGIIAGVVGNAFPAVKGIAEGIASACPI